MDYGFKVIGKTVGGFVREIQPVVTAAGDIVKLIVPKRLLCNPAMRRCASNRRLRPLIPGTRAICFIPRIFITASR